MKVSTKHEKYNYFQKQIQREEEIKNRGSHLQHVESTAVSYETCKKELFLKTNKKGNCESEREQRFAFWNMLKVQRFLLKHVEESCFQKQIFRENRGSFLGIC